VLGEVRHGVHDTAQQNDLRHAVERSELGPQGAQRT